MAEYDDRGEDYGGGEDYSDPSEYQDFRWDNRDDYDNLDELIKEYNEKIDDLNNEKSKKRKDNTRAEVQKEIDKFQNRKRFLETLKNYSRNWNPKLNQITVIKTQIGILEKELRDTNSSLKRCRKPEIIKEKQDKIDVISKTLNFYKKSFSLMKKKSGDLPKLSPHPLFISSEKTRVKRLPTKPTPTEERIPLPKKDEEWSTMKDVKDAGFFLKSALGFSWWGVKGAAKVTSGTVRGIAGASVAVGNAAIEGGKLAAEKGNSLYSTFRENQESEEKVSEQHEEIDRETEQKNEEVVERVENVPPSPEEFYSQDLKTQVINLAIEKNNLEGGNN